MTRKRNKRKLILLFILTFIISFIVGFQVRAMSIPADETVYIEPIPEEPIPVMEKIIEYGDQLYINRMDTMMTEEQLVTEMIKLNYYRSIDELAHLVRAEAGNQDLMGKRLVVDVVLNRVESELFPNTIHDVIYAPSQFAVISNGRWENCADEIDSTDYEACRLEIENRTNDEVLYFAYHSYIHGTTPVIIHQDHNFSK